MRRLLGLAFLYLFVAVLSAAATTDNVVVRLNRGWNAVGFQAQRLTALSANPAVRGFLAWNGKEYTSGNFSLADLNGALASRRGVWVLADEATSFTYSGVDDGSGGAVQLNQSGYQLVTFCLNAEVPVASLVITQNGQGSSLPVLFEIGPNNEYTLADRLRPGRAYWAQADTRNGPVRLNPPGSLGRISGLVNDAAGFQVQLVGGGSTRVNPDGTFVLENVEPGAQTVTVVGSEGQQAAVVTVDVRPGQTANAGLIAPRPSGLVTGVVSSSSGQALAGVSLVATPLTSTVEPVLGTENGRPRLFAVTNARGEYALRGLVPGGYLVTASLPGYLDGNQNVRVASRQSVSANFVLQSARGASVRGRVSVQGGTPVRGAVVSLTRADVPVPLPIPVDPVPPVGRPSPGEPGGTSPGFPGVAPGGTFTSPGGPETTPVSQLPLPIPAGSPGVSEPGLPTPLPSGSPGVSEPGRPIPGPIPVPIPPSRPPLVTFTDAAGNYQLDGVPAGSYVLRVYRFGLDPVAQPVTLVTDQVLVHDVTLVDTTGTVSGQVLSKASGRPIAGAGVAAWPGDIFEPLPTPIPLGDEAGGLATSPPFRGSAVTDPDGRYTLKVPAGSYQVSAFAREFADARQQVVIQVGQTSRADFALEPAPPGAEGPIGLPLIPTLGR